MDIMCTKQQANRNNRQHNIVKYNSSPPHPQNGGEQQKFGFGQ
jgi:hypothetical protein